MFMSNENLLRYFYILIARIKLFLYIDFVGKNFILLLTGGVFCN